MAERASHKRNRAVQAEVVGVVLDLPRRTGNLIMRVEGGTAREREAAVNDLADQVLSPNKQRRGENRQRTSKTFGPPSSFPKGYNPTPIWGTGQADNIKRLN